MKKINFLNPSFYLFVLLTLVFSCKPDSEKSEVPFVEKSFVKAPNFDPDSAFHFVKTQVDFGPRLNNTPAHAQCAEYLVSTLQKFSDTVIVQTADIKAWDGKILKIKNIIASFSPEKANRILLMAHWDTRPWADQDTDRKNEPIDGANDGGSGVAVLLEMARNMKITKPEVGIDIILFDAEDYGQPENSGQASVENSWCLGSQYWSKNPHVPNYHASYGILLDMVGAENATFTQEGTSVQYASNVVNLVWATASKLGFSNQFVYRKTHAITDDHVYVIMNLNIPCIDIIEYDESTFSKFYKHWHTHEDKIENISKRSLHAVGQTLLEVVYNEK